MEGGGCDGVGEAEGDEAEEEGKGWSVKSLVCYDFNRRMTRAHL